jgi:hypothetical protein
MIILITFAPGKNFRNMTRNTDKRRAGSVPAEADDTAACETFGARRAWSSLPLTRRSLRTSPDCIERGSPFIRVLPKRRKQPGYWLQCAGDSAKKKRNDK